MREQKEMLVPDGWGEIELGKIIFERNKSSLKVGDATNYGQFPFFTSGEAVLKHIHKIVEGANIYLATGGVATINYFDGEAAYSTDTYAVTTNEGIETRYLYFNLLNNINYINTNYFQGSGLKHLQKKDLKKHLIQYPESAEEQRHISSILSRVDEAIAQTEQLITKYSLIKTGLMQDILTRGIDEYGNIRSEQTHRFKTKKGLRVPEEWEVYEIGKITDHVGSGITPKGGSNVYGNEGILLIRSQNVLVGEFDLEDVAYITSEINDRMQRSELQDLDVLLNITGASIGRSHFVSLNFPKSNVNQHVCALRIRNGSLGKSLFVSSYLNSYEGQRQIKRLLGASNREGLNYKQIREIKLPMPELEDDAEYQKIYSVLTSINIKIETLKRNLKKQTSLKIGLMQDLLSGKVRVNHLIEETEAV